MNEISCLLDRWPMEEEQDLQTVESFLRETFMLLWKLEIAFKLGWIRERGPRA